MKRIALLIPTLETGGAERVCVNLANELSKRYKVTLITFVTRPTIYKLSPEVRLKAIFDEKKIYRLYFIQRFVRLWLLAFRSDVLISFLWPANYLAILLSRFTFKKVVLTERSVTRVTFDNHTLPDHQEKICRKYSHRAAGMIALTEKGKNDLVHFFGIPPEKVFVIPNAATSPPISKEPIASKFKFPYFLAVGRFHPVKGYDKMLNAFTEIARKFPEQHLVICGNGPLLENMDRFVKEHGLEHRVHFEGVQKELVCYYKYADALLSTSEYEGFPNNILEAMNWGRCPVIAFDCDYGPGAIIQHMKNGMLVPAGHTELFAKACLDYLEHPAWRDKFRENIPESIEVFQSNHIFGKWDAFISTLLMKDRKEGKK